MVGCRLPTRRNPQLPPLGTSRKKRRHLKGQEPLLVQTRMQPSVSYWYTVVIGVEILAPLPGAA